jgi:hypothetical protein
MQLEDTIAKAHSLLGSKTRTIQRVSDRYQRNRIRHVIIMCEAK